MIRRSSATAIVGLASLVTVAGFVAYAAWAGPLDPPAGPVTSTYKTLAEVEPRIAINAANTPGNNFAVYSISAPGSYYLTGNITGVVGKHGIEITASGVTLDLNGFDLVGVPAMGAFDGVSVALNFLTNIAVVNGSVRNWGDEGVDLATPSPANCRVDSVLASGNVGNGISVGACATVSNCSARQNNGNGISVASVCTVSNCAASANTGNGINASNTCTVSNCSASFNTGDGIITGFGCTVSNCSAYSNTRSGIGAQVGSTVTNCSAYQNSGTGIGIGQGGTVSNCSAYQNSGTGIGTSFGCTVTNCSADINSGTGISVNFGGSTVADCTAQGNILDGILCSSDCTIRGNTCSFNGNGVGAGDGAGIHAISTDNRIEGNKCNGADRGIEVNSPGNIIIKNTCSGNAINWVIAANNVCGPILDRTAPASAAISGNAAPDSTGSTHPNANFTY